MLVHVAPILHPASRSLQLPISGSNVWGRRGEQGPVRVAETTCGAARACVVKRVWRILAPHHPESCILRFRMRSPLFAVSWALMKRRTWRGRDMRQSARESSPVRDASPAPRINNNGNRSCATTTTTRNHPTPTPRSHHVHRVLRSDWPYVCSPRRD